MTLFLGGLCRTQQDHAPVFWQRSVTGASRETEGVGAGVKAKKAPLVRHAERKPSSASLSFEMKRPKKFKLRPETPASVTWRRAGPPTATTWPALRFPPVFPATHTHVAGKRGEGVCGV